MIRTDRASGFSLTAVASKNCIGFRRFHFLAGGDCDEGMGQGTRR